MIKHDPRSPSALRLRPLRADDEGAFQDAHQVMAAEGFTFGLGYQPGMAWSSYLEALDEIRRGVNLADDQVPATLLVAEVAGDLVGRSSIRHRLNAYLERQGGHIGYGVLPQHRRRGYATEILRQSLVITRANGIERALVTCDDDNAGSIAVIERCGGELESVVETGNSGPAVRRYWID